MGFLFNEFLILILLVFFNFGHTKSRSEPSCPDGTTPSPFDPNTCYKVINNASDYYTASDACTSAGGQLTSIHSSFENQFILGMSSGSGADSVWLGGANANVNATYMWDDNSPFDYVDWAPGQPPATPGNCITLHLQEGGYWYAEKCNIQKPFICKVSPSKPGSVSCPNGWSYSANTKNCYFMFKGYANMTCDYAHQLCSNKNSTLASIHSFRENAFIQGLASSLNTNTKTVIGLISDVAAWRWQDNTIFNYTHWNDATASQPNSKSCISMGGFQQYGNWFSVQQYPTPSYTTQAICKLSGYGSFKKLERDSICPAGTIQGTSNPNACYKVYSGALNWYSAEKACQKEKGHLISIHNSLENWFFIGIIDNNVPNTVDFWTGGTNDNPNGTWGWIDNSAFDFINWAPENPQNATKLCASERVRSGFWYSTTCDQEKPFICSVPQSATPRNSCPPNFSYFDLTNKCYLVVPTTSTTTCSNVQQICNSLNSSLASIHSIDENYFIAGLAANDTADYNYITYTVIGLTANGNEWTWLDGSFVNYTSWYNTQPFPSYGDCGVMYANYYRPTLLSLWYSAAEAGHFTQVACEVAAV